MAVCQYFMQGRCRFGQNCRNEHSYPNDDRNNRNSLNSLQLSTVVKKIVETVVIAEKGGQWPLSCFSPLREGANFPGWEDYSPEEIRWKMYEARANGTLNQATLEISQLYSNAEKMRNELKEPSPKIVSTISNMLKARTDSTSVSNPFNSLPSSSIFGGATQSSVTNNSQNIFGVSSSPANQGSIFGGVAPTIGNQGSIFGGSPTTTGNQGSIFGGSNQSTGGTFGGTGGFSNQNIFGNSISSNAFSQNTNSQNAGSIFGNTAISSQNIFANQSNMSNQNAFLASSSSGIFSKPSTTSIFEPQKPESLNQNQSFSFNSSQNENIFTTQKSFGKADIFSPQQTTKSAFGGFGQPNAFGSNQQILNEFDASIYSKLEDLNEEEIKSFTSATFAFGKIPLKPPPQKFCK